MRMLLILLLLAALAAGGFLTRPTEAALKSHADAELASASGKDGIGALIDTVVGGLTREGKFEDLLVATRYSVRSGADVIIDCTGAYGQVFCTRPKKN